MGHGNPEERLAELGVYADLDGRLQIGNHARQAGRPTLRCMPPLPVHEEPATPTTSSQTLPGKTLNLTPRQARTWLAILSGKNLSEIAREEGVSRAAIYCRIRGTNGRGGLIERNLWALIWWLHLRDSHL